jgi:hypothetical protein
MEPEGLSPHSQQPATCPYPEPDQSSQKDYANEKFQRPSRKLNPRPSSF